MIFYYIYFVVSVKNEIIIKNGYSLELYSGNLIHLKFEPNAKVDLEKAKQIRDNALLLAKGENFKGILDFRGVSNVTSVESREFMSNPVNFNNLKVCDAFITDTYTTSFLIGIYIKVFAPKTPTKAFSNFEKALKWAQTF